MTEPAARVTMPHMIGEATFMNWSSITIMLVMLFMVAAVTAQDESITEQPEPTPNEIERAARIVEEVKNRLERMTDQPRERWESKFIELRGQLKKAVEVDPTNQNAAEMLNDFDALRDDAEKRYHKVVMEHPWPQRYESFDKPRTQKGLEDEALTFFRGHELFGPRKPLAVQVRGNWKPVDAVGDVTFQWGLPVYVAFDDDLDDDKATLIEATILAEKHSRGGPQSPPFEAVKLSRGVEMARSNVPRHHISSGGFGPLWFLVVLANLIGGVIAAESFVVRFVPAIGTQLRKLDGARAGIGLACLFVGLLAVLWSLLTFSLLADILPHVSLILVGLILGRERLLERRQKRLTDRVQLTGATTKSDRTTYEIDEDGEAQSVAEAAAEQDERVSDAAETATDKVKELLIANREKIEALAAYQSKIGLLCVILGLIHAIVGPGLWLF